MVTKTSNTRKAPSTRKAPAPKAPAFPRFEIPEITTPEELLEALDELTEHVNTRKGMAQDANKAQYWNGQGQALRQLRSLVSQLVTDE